MSKKTAALVLAVIILGGLNAVQFFYFTALNPGTPTEDVPMALNTLLQDKKGLIGKTITVDGYYIVGGSNISILITDPIVWENNSLAPDNYLVISGNIPLALQGKPGSRVYLKGKVSWADADEGVLAMGYGEHSIIQEAEAGKYKDYIASPQIVNITFPLPPATKYAVLVSGGINPEKAYMRYWNDITAMYFILTWLYHYEPENIYVVYKDGVAENGFAPVHGSATHAKLQEVFTELEGKMTGRDDLFIYTTNHGGSSGLSLWGPSDPYALTPNELNNMLNGIAYNKMIIVMEQCKSGVFIAPLSAANRIIMTAASTSQSSYGCDTEGAWDEFVYHFMCAVAETKINGDAGEVNSDTNEDGKVSMYEAFMYASAQDSRPETPYYDDNADGNGMSAWWLQYTTSEGALGKVTFL
ncbi:MAG: C13 family peptidase [Candidatus Odinarchaeota archaeon]